MPSTRTVRLTPAGLPTLSGALDALGPGDRVVVELPAGERVPAAFRNGTPAPGAPALLDAVAPVHALRQAASRSGVDVELRGFPTGVFDDGVPDPPVTAMIEVSSRCNLRCPLCSVGRGALSRRGDMPTALYARIVDELAPSVRRLALHNLGEPLLHRDLPELVRIAKAAGIAEVFLSTNLAVDAPERVAALARSGIDEIVCSLDAATPEIYPVYRVGGRLEVVLRNLDVLRATRQALAAAGAPFPRVRLQFLLFRHNAHERAAFGALAREYGVGYEIKVASAPVDEADAWLPADPALRRVEREADHGWCTRPYNHTTILSTGTVVPCCKDADGRHPLGDLATTPFAAVWAGAPFQAFRARLLADKAGLPLCKRCPGGWFLGSNVVERGADPGPALAAWGEATGPGPGGSGPWAP